MMQEEGFSLMEVLLSLVLVSSLALFLLEKQVQGLSLLSQLSLRIKTAQALEKKAERAWVELSTVS